MGIQNQSTYIERHTINISINSRLLAEAGKLNVDISKAAEKGLSYALVEQRETLWLESNRDALDGSNAYVEKYGLPLGKYRSF